MACTLDQLWLAEGIRISYLEQVKREFRHAKDYVEGLAESGRYAFTSRDVQTALGVSAAAAKLALSRLAKQKLIASMRGGLPGKADQ
jgi:DNA-binding IscR family transcriptional regulator